MSLCCNCVKLLVLPSSDNEVSATQMLGDVVLQNPGEPPYIMASFAIACCSTALLQLHAPQHGIEIDTRFTHGSHKMKARSVYMLLKVEKLPEVAKSLSQAFMCQT